MKPKFFDVHTHLNMQFEADWKEVGERTIRGGTWFVNVGADEKSSQLAVEQARELGPGCFATVGIHPTEREKSNFEVIRGLAREDKVVAIGECGLEYFQLEDKTLQQNQQALFIKHVELALEVDKPLMIHCRASLADKTDAYRDILAILADYKARFGERLCFNMHFFAGDWAIAQKFLALGAYLSFPGVITFTNQYDEIIKKMPLNRLLAETDAPFVAPVPKRGERNEPAYVQFVVARLIELRPEPEVELLQALVANAQEFFDFLPNS